MNRWDFLAMIAIVAAMAYAASVFYPNEFRSFYQNEAVRAFAAIIAVAAFVVLLLDYFLGVFSKASKRW